MSETKRVPTLLTITAIAGVLMFGLLAAQSQAALQHVDGTVVSKNTGSRTFTISTQSGNMRFKVQAGTQFERIAGGFGGLHKGLAIQVDYVRTENGRIAKKVEPQGGGSGGGGGGGGGSDDGPNHT
jgi:hypothetical protein